MLKIVLSNQFKKDLRKAKLKGANLDLLDKIVSKLSNNEKLSPIYRDHSLSGNMSMFRECHIQNDWILIYRIEENELLLYLFRTGTHSDLFG